jgi:hypothetical protein
MSVAPGRCELALAAPAASPVGWLTAIADLLALAVAGLTDQDSRVVRGG